MPMPVAAPAAPAPYTGSLPREDPRRSPKGRPGRSAPYGLRPWIEQSSKQVEDELGWAASRSAPTAPFAATWPWSTTPSPSVGTGGSPDPDPWTPQPEEGPEMRTRTTHAGPTALLTRGIRGHSFLARSPQVRGIDRYHRM